MYINVLLPIICEPSEVYYRNMSCVMYINVLLPIIYEPSEVYYRNMSCVFNYISTCLSFDLYGNYIFNMLLCQASLVYRYLLLSVPVNLT